MLEIKNTITEMKNRFDQLISKTRHGCGKNREKILTANVKTKKQTKKKD